MGRKSAKGTVSFGGIVAIIICAILAFAGIYHFSNGQAVELGRSFAVLYNGEYILSDQTGLVFEKGDELEIKQFEGENAISARVYAIKNESQDIQFGFGGQTYTWNGSLAPRDVTQDFDITVTQQKGEENGRIRLNSGIHEILQSYAGEGKISYEPFIQRGDYFLLEIVVKNGGSITLGFSVAVEVEGISLDKDKVIF